jgi:hypothetical protein
LQHHPINPLRNFRRALDRRADGQRDVQVELPLMNLRDQVAAEPWNDQEKRYQQRRERCPEHQEAVSQRDRQPSRIAVLQPIVAPFEHI